MTAETIEKEQAYSQPILGYYVYRILGNKITRQLVKTPVRPNQVTLFSLSLGLVACGFYLQGTQFYLVCGAITLYFSKLLDYVDGGVARTKGMSSKVGAWLDSYTDFYKIVLPLISITLGNYLLTQDASILIIGFMGAIFYLAFMVTRLMQLVMIKKERWADYQITKETHLGWTTPSSIIIIFFTLFNQPYYLLLFFGTIGVLPLLIKIYNSYRAINDLDKKEKEQSPEGALSPRLSH